MHPRLSQALSVAAFLVVVLGWWALSGQPLWSVLVVAAVVAVVITWATDRSRRRDPRFTPADADERGRGTVTDPTRALRTTGGLATLWVWGGWTGSTAWGGFDGGGHAGGHGGGHGGGWHGDGGGHGGGGFDGGGGFGGGDGGGGF